jgi:hypothetical protein
MSGYVSGYAGYAFAAAKATFSWCAKSMSAYTIELFDTDDAIMARSERDAPNLTRDEMLAWARDAAEKFGMVWDINDRVRAPSLGYACILCDGGEVLRLKVPSELSLQ